jgi:hypothetical protein
MCCIYYVHIVKFAKDSTTSSKLISNGGERRWEGEGEGGKVWEGGRGGKGEKYGGGGGRERGGKMGIEGGTCPNLPPGKIGEEKHGKFVPESVFLNF